MSDTDNRFDVLFEPVPIGPVTAPNRFYQVPHCTGLGWQRPQMLAGLRAMKAEGGWGVVNTEYCSIHPTSDDLPYPYASLWDEGDIRNHALMTDQVHAHGALAGVELWHGGARSPNLYTRDVPMDVSSLPNLAGNPYQCRAMDKEDIRQFRQWHRDAAIRAKRAGFDIVYVYAAHGYLVSNFLSPAFNQRTDEYGGSTENRARLLRELLEETRDAVGDTCAVACRYSVDDGGGEDGAPVYGHKRETFEMLAELPDLWDLTIADYSLEMGVSRFADQGALENYVSFAKTVTTKPVVTVGRFTSPDAMVSQIRRGVVDLIGAARPSIADPFLPRKVREARFDDIRECIGCNICYSCDGKAVPLRCTQNPTMGEEWRRGWHPEKIAPKAADETILIVGAGPAGLEAACALGNRGYSVVLAEATDVLGGRVTREAALPGLSEWIRVRDYREQQLIKMANVEVYRESRLDSEHVLSFGADHVAIATGAAWRRDGFGRSHTTAFPELGSAETVFTPDDIMAGKQPDGRVVIFDDDLYYMASVLAERLAGQGCEVSFVTGAASVAPWSDYTAEQARAQRRLIELGVDIVTDHTLAGFDGSRVRLSCVYTGRERLLEADALVPVTARQPDDGLYRALHEHPERWRDAGIKSIRKIGDCDAPGIIAAAVYAGHRYARELGGEDGPAGARDRVVA